MHKVLLVILLILSVATFGFFASRSSISSAPPLTLAIIGDSLTDEYRADDNRGVPYGATTLNWAELLVGYKGVSLGAWGNWGGVRRTGYEYNWARTGATTSSMISQGQHTGVAGQVSAGLIQNVFIAIGPNDFTPVTPQIYAGTMQGVQLTNFVNGLVNNVRTAVTTVQSAGTPRIVISTVHLDLALHPQGAMLPDPAGRQRIYDAFNMYNNGLRALAQEKGALILEASGMINEFYERLVQGNKLNVGGELIDFATVGNEPHHIYLSDSTHLGTVSSAIYANEWMLEMNRLLGTDFTIFTDPEILTMSGILAPTPTLTASPSPTIVPTSTPTMTPTPSPVPTVTPSPTPIPTVTPTQTPVPTAGPVTLTIPVSASANDANQDGTNVNTSTSTLYVGTGGTASSSYSGFRFANVQIPKNAVIQSAKLELYSTQSQWVSIAMSIAAENIGNSPAFSNTAKLSTRSLTSNKVAHSSNVSWSANTWYQLNEMAPVIQQVVNRADWAQGNSMSVILKGTGSAWGRKFVRTFDGGSANAPKLVIRYSL